MTDTVATDVAVLKKDVERMGEFFGRLDTAIEKISELSNTITSMLAVHDERLDRQDETNLKIFGTIENTQKEIGVQIRELQTLIGSTKMEMSTAIASFDGRVNEIIEKKTIEKINENGRRIRSLEKWRWIVVGGGLVIIGLLSMVVPELIKHYAGK